MSNINTKEDTPQGLKEKRARRQRIKRMKTGILLFLAIWLSACMGLNIFLMIRVTSLQNQIGILAEKVIESTQIRAEAAAPSPGSKGGYVTYDEEEAVQEPVDEASAEDAQPTDRQVRDCIDLEDNLRGEGDPMTVYLTFDDGPSENTPQILSILKEHGVKATFFVTGKESDEAKEWYKQIVAEGHTLGMHSYSHKYSAIYESVDAFAADFTKLHDFLEDTTGVDCKFYRFPGGSSNQVSNTDMNEFIDYLSDQGMIYYDWNVVCGDATSQIYTADDLVQNVMTDVVKYKYSVVLMHDAAEKDSTVEALETILQKLEDMNAEILPITEDAQVVHHDLNS